MTPVAPDDRWGRLFGRLAATAIRRRRTVLAVALLLAGATAALAAARLELRTSNLDLVDPALPPVAAFRAFARDFGTPNVLVVVFAGEDPAALRQAVDTVEPRLAAVPGVRRVAARLPVDPVRAAAAGLDPYLASRDGGLLFAFVQPRDPDSSAAALAPLVAGVEEALAEARLDQTAVRAGLTGLPRYALDDRDVIQQDLTTLSLVSLLLVGLLFATAFGAFVRPLLVVATLLLAVAVTLGVVAIVPGHLTLVSSFFASILFGLGVDYGIHVVDRTEELLGEGLGIAEAVPAAMASLGRGLASGALTTASAFFTLLASGFRGFAELGWIAGAGVLVCLAATATVLPALLVTFGGRAGRVRPPERRRLGRLLGRLPGRPAAALLALAALAGFAAGPPEFDSDYLALQAEGSEAVRLEREMVRRSDLSPQFAAFVTASADAERRLVERLRREPTVGAVRSAADVEGLAAAGLADPAAAVAWRDAFVAADGRRAVYAYPRGDVWERGFQDAFLARMRALDPGVTGMPVLGRFMVDRSRRALEVTAVLGSLALAAWLLIDLRSPLWAAAAAVPTVLAMGATLGTMRLLGISFNPLDVMALPVILGIAVDDGIHLVHRFRAEGGDVARTLAGTGRSVALTSLTSLAAFGALAFTRHRGLASFAEVLAIGVTAALVLSLVVLPPLLTVVARWRGGRSEGPAMDEALERSRP
ncbi:MAG TPA: MMPL family transporter [Thermoanaerobaculia bacterium]